MPNTKAHAEKEKGNAAFKAGDYPTAIGHYSSAIFADRSDPTFPLNRAAAYLKLGKNEDAERDCSTVLGLSPANTKALFRRGQARIGTGKLVEAQRDFTEALRLEPGNVSVKEELKKVADLIEKQKQKNSRSVSAAPMTSSLVPEAAPQRRRVPIKIVDVPASSPPPSGSKTTSSAPLASVQPNPLPEKPSPSPKPVVDIDTLQPVSSRSLKKSSPSLSASAETAPKGSPPPAPAASSSTSPPKAPKATSFKDAKQSRDNAKPSRVGGGIFRASGNNTFFTIRDGGRKSPPADAAPSAAETSSNKSASGTPSESPTNRVPIQVPTSLFEFTQAWQRVSSVQYRWALISTIPPSNIPTLFKSSLEPTLLVSILETFQAMLKADGMNSPTGHKMKDYMDNLARVPRFATLVLFLSKSEKELASEIWKSLGITSPTGPWAPVGHSK